MISRCETTTADGPNVRCGPRTSFDAALPPALALEMLREGNQRYVDEDFHGHQATDQWRSTLAQDGQKPAAAVIGCADSRCPVELLFDAQPGDLFVLRNAGNTCSLAEGSIVGSVEYAIGHLGTQLVFVLGHTRCGAIAGATKTMLSSRCQDCPQACTAKRRPSRLDSLLEGLMPVVAAAASELAADAVEEDVAAHAVKVNIFTTMDKLMRYSKLLRSKVESGEVEVHGGIYDLESGTVEFLGKRPAAQQDLSLCPGSSLASGELLRRAAVPDARVPHPDLPTVDPRGPFVQQHVLVPATPRKRRESTPADAQAPELQAEPPPVPEVPHGFRRETRNKSKLYPCTPKKSSVETLATITHRSAEPMISRCETTTADGPNVRCGPRTSFDAALPPALALEMLREGNQRYVDEDFNGHQATDQWRSTLAQDGQKPAAVVIGCADSRCPVELLFDAQPGDLFVLRNAGNTCPLAEGSIVGSVEYAIGHLGTQLVFVLGHTRCGAIAGATKTMLSSRCPDCPQAGRAKGRPSRLDSLLEGLVPVAAAAASELAADAVEEDVAAHAVKVNVFTTMDKLIGYSKLLRSKVESGEVEVHGGIYDLESGTVEFLGQRPAAQQDSSLCSGSSWASGELLRHAAAPDARVPHPDLHTVDQRAPFMQQHAFVPATPRKLRDSTPAGTRVPELQAEPSLVPGVLDGFRRETWNESKIYPCTPEKSSSETSATTTHRSTEPTISQCETTTADGPNVRCGPRTSFDAALPPTLALEMLREGNQRYVDEDFHGHQATDQWRSTLAQDGQKPAAVVIGCADSRCPVELLFDAQPGDLFVLRNAGNTCPLAEGSIVGSVEYAIGHLGTQLVFVLGHTRCGAIAGATKTMLSSRCPDCPQACTAKRRPSRLDSLLEGLVPVAAAAASELPADAVEEDVAARAVKVNIFTTMDKLMRYSKLLRSKVESGEVEVHGGIYDLESGTVEFLGQRPAAQQDSTLCSGSSWASGELLRHAAVPEAHVPHPDLPTVDQQAPFMQQHAFVPATPRKRRESTPADTQAPELQAEPSPVPGVLDGFRRETWNESKTCPCTPQKPSIETSAMMTCRPSEPTISQCDMTTVDGPNVRCGPRTSFDAALPPMLALEMLREGNQRYVDEDFNGHQATDQWRSALAKDGQKPAAVVIGCADSRCPVELVFDAQPGDLFVLRNAGNTCSRAEGSIVGSVEYAIGHLGTQLVFVLGHTKCGAIAGATKTMLSSKCLDCPQAGTSQRRLSLLESMLQDLAPVAAAAASELPADAIEEDVAAHAVKVNVLTTMDRLMRYSKLLRSKVEAGEVQVHGGIYDLESGKVEFISQGSEPTQATSLSLENSSASKALLHAPALSP